MPKSAKQMLDIILAAVLVELRKDGTDGNLCSVTKFPGEGVALDYAECGGMLWVRLVSAAPSASFPAPVQSLDNCARSLAFPVEVGLMRPAPIPANFVTGEMDLPSDEDHSAATDRQLDDMQAMYRGLRAAQQEIEYMIVGNYSPQGPTGGTVGGVWSLTVGDD